MKVTLNQKINEKARARDVMILFRAGSGSVTLEVCIMRFFFHSLLQCWRRVFVFTYLLGVQCVSSSKECVSKIIEPYFSFGAAVCYIILQVSIVFAFPIVCCGHY